ncbi:transposase [Falsiroseomonas sp.]|uniref:transposase n=1 Tax=Falsiroseomonas sp. TaxID=2870721 RepID=UPI0035631543
MLPVSKDTLLRVVRRRVAPTEPGARIIGIDEWAWRRDQRYGTIICDLERRRVLDLLPDREPATVRAWLSSQPGIHVVAQDRASGYAGAIAAAAPLAVQVADRWHLMENASATFLQAVRSEMGPIRRALGAGVIDPALLSAAERLQYEGYLRRREENSAIRAMAHAGTAIKEIARRTGRSRKLVRAALRNADDEVFRSRHSSQAPWFVALDEAWSAGCRNGAELLAVSARPRLRWQPAGRRRVGHSSASKRTG